MGRAAHTWPEVPGRVVAFILCTVESQPLRVSTRGQFSVLTNHSRCP